MHAKLITAFFFLPLAFLSAGALQELDDKNFNDVFEGSWLIMFYAPWCPACQGLRPLWQKLANEDRTDGLKFADVNVNTHPALSGQFLIFNLPSFYYVRDGVCRLYTGQQDMSAMESWVVDGKWKSTEAIASWRSPDSFLMRSVGKFFKFANKLRVLQKVMVDDYALPYWVVYLIFVVVTIIVGLVIGLMFVCCCDCLCPPKQQAEEQTDVIEEEAEEDEMEEEVADGEEEADDGQQVRRRTRRDDQ